MSKLSLMVYILGGVIFLMPNFYASWKFQKLNESELVDFSPKYFGISKVYGKYVICWAIFSVLIVFSIWYLLRFLDGTPPELIGSFFLVIIFSSASLLPGIFAMQNGVYPISKYYGVNTRFAYDGLGSVQKFGRLIVSITASCILLSIIALVFLV